MFVLLSELGLGLSKGTALGPELGLESYMMGVPVFTSVSGTKADMLPGFGLNPDCPHQFG